MINWDIVGLFSCLALFLILIRCVDKSLYSIYSVSCPLPFWHLKISFKKKILTAQEKFMKNYKGAKHGI